MGVTVVEHPLAARHLAMLRDTRTSPRAFRETMADVAAMLLYEALRDMAVQPREVHTPLDVTTGVRLEHEVVLIAILRAGLGMLQGALRTVPEARVGHIGLQRDEQALTPRGYYENLPAATAGGEVIVVDPMLATGGSAIHALTRVREERPQQLRFVCLVAAPEGLNALQEAHPDVPITCAAIDERLDERGYIRPGLGDAGDRMFGTE
jgi:uracil phosphoribosyltransferase